MLIIGSHNFPTFKNNPQYPIDLKKGGNDGKCSVLIELMQKSQQQQKRLGEHDLSIAFSVYKVMKETIKK